MSSQITEMRLTFNTNILNQNSRNLAKQVLGNIFAKIDILFQPGRTTKTSILDCRGNKLRHLKSGQLVTMPNIFPI